ncbi:MAG: hypothetical protein H0S85_04665 [Desulfovibrionaceae bacterium]|nr:hypothetical protein [Desulfovibrionaceae bacterium]
MTRPNCSSGSAIPDHPVLRHAVRLVPALGEMLARHGEKTLVEYDRHLLRWSPDPVQPPDDFCAEVAALAGDLLGPAAAEAARAALARAPVVVTGPHHGFDTMPVTVQGTLAFSLGVAGKGGDGGALFVLGSGNVPLSNYTTPGGLALARSRAGGQGQGSGQGPWGTDAGAHTRVHFFPAAERARLVRGCGPLDERMVERARRRVQALFQEGTLTLAEKRGVDALLAEVFGAPEVLARSSLSAQATVAAASLWTRLRADAARPRLLHLEKDEIVCRLLRRDLEQSASLAHRVFFDARLRARVVALLDGAYGCWSVQRLEALSDQEGSSGHVFSGHGSSGHDPAPGGYGTAFFWGLDERGARVPMLLDEPERGEPVLRPAPAPEGAVGLPEPVPFTPEGLGRALEARALLPNLFTTFLTVGFARGVRCVGGQLQAGYLPVMREALAEALAATGAAADAARVAALPVRAVTTGLMGVLRGDPAGTGRMAGAVEMALAGGLDGAALARLGRLSVGRAVLAGMLEMYPVLAAPAERLENWEADLRAAVAREAGDGLVLLPE